MQILRETPARFTGQHRPDLHRPSYQRPLSIYKTAVVFINIVYLNKLLCETNKTDSQGNKKKFELKYIYLLFN